MVVLGLTKPPTDFSINLIYCLKKKKVRSERCSISRDKNYSIKLWTIYQMSSLRVIMTRKNNARNNKAHRNCLQCSANPTFAGLCLDVKYSIILN